MERPPCPACRDAWSVAKLSALHHLEDFPLADSFRPPAAPPSPGRFLGMATLAGLVLYVLTAFTLLWLVAALCIGVVAELLAYWEKMEEREEYHAARAWWDAAYYCSGHGIVFIVGEPDTFWPAQFASILHGTAAPALPPGDEPPLLRPAPDPAQSS